MIRFALMEKNRGLVFMGKVPSYNIVIICEIIYDLLNKLYKKNYNFYSLGHVLNYYFCHL